MKVASCTAALVVAATACGSGSSARVPETREARSGVSPLPVAQARTPPLRLPNYRTSGTYPRVSGGQVELGAVNAAIRRAVLGVQHRYAAFVRREYISSMPQLFRRGYRYSGTYRTSPRLSLISASTVVVSALVPVREVLPGGTGGATWLSVTVRVPSGAQVGLRRLFAQPDRGLRALASAARRTVLATNRCVRASNRGPGRAINARGFAPTPRNYRYFALTAQGFAVGFPIDQVGASSCGSVQATVPYGVLRPYLSALGQRLVAGVRRPRR
jgi:hypothetical protein